MKYDVVISNAIGGAAGGATFGSFWGTTGSFIGIIVGATIGAIAELASLKRKAVSSKQTSSKVIH